MNKHEMLSALADGQLRGTAFAQAVDHVLHDDEARATWHRYHLIGDVLRSGELARCEGDGAFLARLQGRLKQEPGFARPVPVEQPSQVAVADAVAGRANGAPVSTALPMAANEPAFRWKMVAGFASMAAVAAIGWNLIGAPGMPGASQASSQQIALVSAPTLASVSSELGPMAAASPIQLVQFSAPMPAAAPVPPSQTVQAVTLPGGEPQVMIRDRRLDELMAAHKQFGGTSALQMPAGFLRNATFDAPAR
ncbi:sigma-E factor negative regulatory protein [Rhodoferax koreensis]|uniref:sigma-E factor negative regulatory protein n=1 Tax=Rhodoferax koreensis TaxID=1842727 RepID=UPI003084578D